MNSVPLLIFWLLPLLPAGGNGPSLHVADQPLTDAYGVRMLVQQPIDSDLPVIRELMLQAATDGDGEGPYDGSLFDSTPALFSLWERRAGDDLSFLIHPEHDHHRSLPLVLPLLC